LPHKEGANIKKRSTLLIIGTIVIISIVLLLINTSGTKQGTIDYEEINIKDIENEEVLKWIETNSKFKGIHEKNLNSYTYILLSMGEKQIEGYAIKVSSIESEKDKILVNGNVTLENPSSNVNYPFKLIQIPKDKRAIYIKDFNIFEIDEDTTETGIETAIVKSLNDKELNIEIIRKSLGYTKFPLDSKTKELVTSSEIKEGDFIIIEYTVERNNNDPQLKNVRKINKTITDVTFEGLDDKDYILVSSNEQVIALKGIEIVINRAKGLTKGQEVTIAIEQVEGTLIIQDIR